MASINLLQGTAYDTLKNPFNTGTTDFGQYNFNAATPADVIAVSIGSGNVISQFTFPPDLPKYYFTIIECDLSMSRVLTFEKVYRLPLPTPLVEGHQINYDTGGNWLSMLGGTAGNLLNFGKDVFSTVTGMAVNDLKSVTLKAPQYSVYNHSFKLVPKTFQESVTINNILWSLRRGAHPRKILGGNGPASAGTWVLGFPKVYLPMFIPNMRFLFKFKPCVIQAISIDFEGGNGLPAFYAHEGKNLKAFQFGSEKLGPGLQGITYNASYNPPESVILNIQWLELEYWLNTDFNQTSNPFDAFNYYNNKPLVGV